MAVRATHDGYTLRIDANASGYAFSGMQMIPGFVSQSPTYVVWVSGTTYRAALANTGLITHSGTNLRVIIDSITDTLCQSGVGTGGTIFFKDGLYLPTARFDIPNDDTLAAQYASLSGNCSVAIKGESRDRTIIRCTVDNNHIIQARTSRFRIENITLDGNFISANCITSDYGIHFEADNCRIRAAGHGDRNVSGSLGSSGWDGFGIWLGNNSAGGSGMWVSGVRSFIISNNIFEYANSIQEDCCPTCLDFGIVTNNTFDRRWADEQGWGGSQLTGGSAQNWIASNNTFMRHSGNQLGITKELNGQEKNITIANNNLLNGRILVGFSSIGNEGVQARGINVVNNVIRGGNITIQGPDRNSLGSGISDPTTWRTYIQDVVIQGNTLTDSYFKGIKLYRCENVLVKDNYLRNSNAAGNLVSGDDLGLINAEQTINSTIRDNVLVMDDNKTAYGIRYQSGSNLTLENNLIKNTAVSGNASFRDVGGNVGTQIVEYQTKSTGRKYGELNVFATTGTSNLGDGILATRFQTDLSGNASFPTTVYISGMPARQMSTGSGAYSLVGWRYNTNLLRRESYIKLTSKFQIEAATNLQFGVFFTNNATVTVVSGTDVDVLSGRQGCGFLYNNASSVNIRTISNDGIGGSDISEVFGGTNPGSGIHTISIYSDHTSGQFILEYDTKPIMQTQQIPAAGTSMGFYAYAMNTANNSGIVNMAALEMETN